MDAERPHGARDAETTDAAADQPAPGSGGDREQNVAALPPSAEAARHETPAPQTAGDELVLTPQPAVFVRPSAGDEVAIQSSEVAAEASSMASSLDEARMDADAPTWQDATDPAPSAGLTEAGGDPMPTTATPSAGGPADDASSDASAVDEIEPPFVSLDASQAARREAPLAGAASMPLANMHPQFDDLVLRPGHHVEIQQMPLIMGQNSGLEIAQVYSQADELQTSADTRAPLSRSFEPPVAPEPASASEQSTLPRTIVLVTIEDSDRFIHQAVEAALPRISALLTEIAQMEISSVMFERDAAMRAVTGR